MGIGKTLRTSIIHEIDDLATAFETFSPGAGWNAFTYVDANTCVKIENFFLAYQDTYIMGDHGYFMGSTDIEIPEKYSCTK